MKRIFLLLLSLSLLLVSCVEEPEREINLNLSNIGEGSTRVKIGSKTLLSVEGISLKDGITIYRNGSRGLSWRGSDDTTSGFIRTESNDIILSPDEEGSVSVTGAEMGFGRSENVEIRRFRNIQDDFSITPDEYNGVTSGIIEEYYYIDFNDPKYSELDRSCLAIEEASGSVCGIKILTSDGVISSNRGIYDFSGVDEIGIYAYTHMASWFSVQIKNPYILTPEEEIEVPASNEKIYVPLTNGKSYRIDIKFGEVVGMGMHQGFFLAYEKNGLPWSRLLMPEFDEENKTIHLYTGPVDKPFFFSTDNSLGSNGPNRYVITMEEDDYYPELIDIAKESVSVYKEEGKSYYVVPFYSSEDVLLTDSFENNWPLTIVTKPGTNDFGNTLQWGIKKGNIGLRVYQVLSGSVGDLIGTISKREVMTSSPHSHLVFDSESEKYYCTDDGCSASGIWDLSEYFSAIVAPRILTAVDEEGAVINFEKYGPLKLTSGPGIIAPDGLAFNNTTFGTAGGPKDPLGITGWHDAQKDYQVTIRFKEIFFTDGKLSSVLTDVLAFTTETEYVLYEDILFSDSVHEHSFTRNGDYLECTGCDTRLFSQDLVLNMTSLKLTIEGLRDGDKMLFMDMESLATLLFAGNGVTEFPEVPYGREVVAAVSSSDASFTFSVSGKRINVSVSYD